MLKIKVKLANKSNLFISLAPNNVTLTGEDTAVVYKTLDVQKALLSGLLIQVND